MDLERTIRSVVEASGLELVEAAFHHGGGRQLLRVTVDRQADTPALREQASSLAVAIGLAVRRPEDK